MELTRRKLLGGLGLLIAAPAIIRVADLMPIRAIEVEALRSKVTERYAYGWVNQKFLDDLYLRGFGMVQTRWKEGELLEVLHIPTNQLIAPAVG